MTETDFTPAEVFPPSCCIRDELAARAWNHAEFARRSGLSPERVRRIMFDGPMTDIEADAVGAAFGTSGEMFRKLEAAWRRSRLRPLGYYELYNRLCHAVFMAGSEGDSWLIEYRNWKGEVAVRRILPRGLRWGEAPPWHTAPQWLLDATDVDKGEERTFAVGDILRVS